MGSCSGIQRSSSKREGIRTGDFDAAAARGHLSPRWRIALYGGRGTFVRSVTDWRRSGVGVGDNEGEIIVALSASELCPGQQPLRGRFTWNAR